MTNAPTSLSAAPVASNDNSRHTGLPASAGAIGMTDRAASDGAGGAHASPPLAVERRETDLPDPTDEILVDQAGRPLGPRALRTRRKILEATVALLAEKPMRDMRVIDIARSIGSSPATFYQYFKDVEDVVLHLAGQMKESTPELVELIGGDWDGPEGHARGRKISNLVIDHWDRFAPVLRARNNASDEGNMALREERMAAMLPLVDAFRAAIDRSLAKAQDAEAKTPEGAAAEEWQGGRVDPLVGATALTSAIERLSMYHSWIAELGGSRENLVETTATLMQSILTARR